MKKLFLIAILSVFAFGEDEAQVRLMCRNDIGLLREISKNFDRIKFECEQKRKSYILPETHALCDDVVKNANEIKVQLKDSEEVCKAALQRLKELEFR